MEKPTPKFCLALVWVDRNETRMDWFLDNTYLVVPHYTDEDQPNRVQLETMRDKIDEMLRDYDNGWDPVAIRAEDATLDEEWDEEEGGEEYNSIPGDVGARDTF